MTDLFPLQESLSPKLRWLAAHNLRTNLDELPRAYIGPATTLPWVCGNVARTLNAFGETEEKAIVAACELFDIDHWTVEEMKAEKCPVCGGQEPCSHDFGATGKQLEDIGRRMGTELGPRVLDPEA